MSGLPGILGLQLPSSLACPLMKEDRNCGPAITGGPHVLCTFSKLCNKVYTVQFILVLGIVHHGLMKAEQSNIATAAIQIILW